MSGVYLFAFCVCLFICNKYVSAIEGEISGGVLNVRTPERPTDWSLLEGELLISQVLSEFSTFVRRLSGYIIVVAL